MTLPNNVELVHIKSCKIERVMWQLQVPNGDAKDENGMQVEAETVEEGDGEEDAYDEHDEETHEGAAVEDEDDYYDEYE